MAARAVRLPVPGGDVRPAINPDRLQSFALAYAPAVLEAVKAVGPWMGRQSAEDYAVRIALANLETLQRAGVEALMQYYLNATGGAFRLTCDALGLPCSVQAVENYLGGA